MTTAATVAVDTVPARHSGHRRVPVDTVPVDTVPVDTVPVDTAAVPVAIASHLPSSPFPGYPASALARKHAGQIRLAP